MKKQRDPYERVDAARPELRTADENRRRALLRRAGRRGYPSLDLPDRYSSVGPGEEAWRGFCERADLEWLRQAEYSLNRRRDRGWREHRREKRA